jgi:hypothetical protein
MGNFREMSFKHLKGNKLKLSLDIHDETAGDVRIISWWEQDKVSALPGLSRLQASCKFFRFELEKKKKYTIQVENFLDDSFEKEPFFIELLSNYGQDMFSGLVAKSDSVKLPPFDSIYRPKNKKLSLTLDRLSDLKETALAKGDFYIYALTQQLKRFLTKLHGHINFVSSFRLHPERTYYETAKTDLTVGKFGEDHINQIIQWETQKAKEYQDLMEIMKSLSLLREIHARRLEGGRFELIVKVSENSVPASLNDVGFGISQFLPIIVADLQLGEASTLFLAQPEIHLHPGVQAEFGNYMLTQINRSKKNYIVETHSEYLLNRIRLAVVKGEIPKEDVKIYYFQNDGEETRTHRLEFTTSGQILNAPEDFFKTYMMDVMNIAVNADSGEG